MRDASRGRRRDRPAHVLGDQVGVDQRRRPASPPPSAPVTCAIRSVALPGHPDARHGRRPRQVGRGGARRRPSRAAPRPARVPRARRAARRTAASTVSADRATTSPDSSRTPLSRPSLDQHLGRRSPAPPGRPGRAAARPPRRSAPERCAGARTTSSDHCRNSSAWCTDARRRARARRSAGRAPPSRGSTGSAARRGPSARAGRGRRAGRRQAGGHEQPSRALGASRRRGSRRSPPSSRRAATTRPLSTRPAVRPPARPCRVPELQRRHAFLPEHPVHPVGGAFRGVPSSTTSTDRRARASVTAPLSPAAPPPITTTSTSLAHAASSVGRHRAPASIVAEVANCAGMDDVDSADAHGRPPAPGGPAAARPDARAGVRDDRDLRQHAVPAGVRHPTPAAGAPGAAGRASTGCRSTSSSAPPPPATRASTRGPSPSTA